MQEAVAKDKIRQIEAALTQAGFGLFQFKLLAVCGIAQIGAYAAYTSGLVGAREISANPQYIIWPEWIMKSVFSWICGILIDKFGRVSALYTALVLCTSLLVPACFASLELYLVLRALGCIFIGSLQVINYVIMSEFCPRSHRSRCLFVLVLMDCIGTLYGCGMLVLSNLDWRTRMLLSLIPLPVALLLAISIIGFKETPFFLVISGNAEKANSVLLGISRNLPSHTSSLRNLTGPNSTVSIQERGSLSQLRKVDLLPHLLGLWAVQAVTYWGAMSALPRLYQVWTNSSSSSSFNLEILLLLYAFEFAGIALAAFGSVKFDPYRTLWVMLIVGACLLGLTCLSLGLNLLWFLAASVCGMFACLTPIWGILFVITTERFPTHCRATGLGLMLSTRVIQGVLEIALPTELSVNVPILPVIYSVVATVFAVIGIFIAKRLQALVAPPAPMRARTWSITSSTTKCRTNGL
jgi:MFS family permease